MTYKPGAQYRVQIDTVMKEIDGILWSDGVGWGVGSPMLEALNATVTEVAPPEPPVGSIWRVSRGDDKAQSDALIERTRDWSSSAGDWWVRGGINEGWMTWDEVRALPGRVIYTPGEDA